MSLRRGLGYALIAAVLAVAFAGYLRPALVMNWETLIALCGLR